VRQALAEDIRRRADRQYRGRGFRACLTNHCANQIISEAMTTAAR
jgi:hypothetical protein